MLQKRHQFAQFFHSILSFYFWSFWLESTKIQDLDEPRWRL